MQLLRKTILTFVSCPFKPHIITNQLEHATMSPRSSIPLVDFQPFLTGDILDRQRVASEVDEALSSAGFLYLSNHGIAQSKVDESFDWVSILSLRKRYTTSVSLMYGAFRADDSLRYQKPQG